MSEQHVWAVAGNRHDAYIQIMSPLQTVEKRDTNISPGQRKTRVVLANDHPGLRRSLRLLLEREAELEVVGEASDFETAEDQVAVNIPDVVVLDLRMPDGFSAERIKRLQTLSPATAIVVTTMHMNEAFAIEAVRAGAIGFVVADSADRELVEAVRRAVRGLSYTSPRVRRAVA